MSNPHTITVFETAKPLLENTLCCLVVASVLCFFHALATRNVYASYYCFVSLMLTLWVGETYMHLILVANNSSWAIVFDVMNAIYIISRIVQDVRSTLKAYKPIFTGEIPKVTALEEHLLKKEAELIEREEILSKWEDILSKQEEALLTKMEDGTHAV